MITKGMRYTEEFKRDAVSQVTDRVLIGLTIGVQYEGNCYTTKL